MNWVLANLTPIRAPAEATSQVAKLQYIDPYVANKFVFLRFNFSTGDAAGQNMVGPATSAAYKWILDNCDGIESPYLESQFATDRKASHINIMRTRGKRVTAEATITRDVLRDHLRAMPVRLAHHYGVANIEHSFRGRPATPCSLPTELRPCLSPQGRTSRTWRNHRPEFFTPN